MDDITNYSHLVIKADENGIKLAAELISSNNIVAFPTETVYGLGANALNKDAVESIFTAKGRPLTDPLIVHVAEMKQALELVDLVGEEKNIFDALGTSFWPGPLTLIAKSSSLIPPVVTANTGYVGIRCPAHPLAIALLQACRLPVAAPSANRFGHVSPTKSHHVIADLGCKGVHVLCGDDEVHETLTCEHGIESTVAKLNGKEKTITIFRQGAVTQKRIEAILHARGFSWKVEVGSRVVKMVAPTIPDETKDGLAKEPDGIDEQGQEAPGQAITHYSPDVPCVIVSSLTGVPGGTKPHDGVAVGEIHSMTLDQQLVKTVSEVGSAVVIDFGGHLVALKDIALAYRDLSPEGKPNAAAKLLFEGLRWAESIPGATNVFISQILRRGQAASDVECDETESDPSNSKRQKIEANDGDNDDILLGLADRVFRAASGNIVQLHVV